MKKILIVAISALCIGSGASIIALADVASLRGENPLDSAAVQFDRRKPVTTDGGFERSWKQQPPQIPHKIDKDEITLQVNTCLKCHDATTHKEEKAPMVADSHLMVVDGTATDKLDMRRYFCTQCHGSQLNVEPLIENTFETVKQ